MDFFSVVVGQIDFPEGLHVGIYDGLRSYELLPEGLQTARDLQQKNLGRRRKASLSELGREIQRRGILVVLLYSRGEQRMPRVLNGKTGVLCLTLD